MVRKINLIIFLILCTHFDTRSRGYKIFKIMLDPAGDARETGRIIEDTLERAVTIQCAQKLQEAIESYLPNSNVLLTRSAGESVQPLQNANFCNRMKVDLYISINCVHVPNQKPTLYLYQFSLGDMFVTPHYDLAMIPYDKAHQKSSSLSHQYGKKINRFLQDKEYLRFFSTQGLYQLPFAPLVGIQAPAIALEINIPSKNKWHDFIRPIARSIAAALES